MAEAEAELKSRILRLLEEDREFRLSVAGLVGFKEVLERLEEHDRKFDEILATLAEHSRRFEEHDRKFDEILATLAEHSRRFEEHDRKFDEILGRLEEHDRKFNEILGRLEEHDRRFEEHARILNGLDLKIEALGSRWGIFSEQAFRGVKPKLAIISPFVEPDAKEEAEFHGIPVFTRTSLK